MLINKNEWLDFLSKVLLKNELENNEIIINIEETKMEVLTTSKGNIAVVYGVMNGDFNMIARWGIGNLKLFIDLLSQFKEDEVDITKIENKLILSSAEKLKITLALKNPEYIINTVSMEKYNEVEAKANSNWFALSLDTINKIRSYANSLKTNELTLNSKDEVLSVSLANTIEKDGKTIVENEILASFESKSTGTKTKDFSVRIGSILFNVLDTLKNDVEISMANKSPVAIRYMNKNINLMYVLAPLK